MEQDIEWCKLVPEITVTDFARSLAFYVEILGFEIKFQRTDPDFAYLDFEGAQVMIEAWHEDGWDTGKLEHPFGRGINFQIECSDSNALEAALSAHDIALYCPPEVAWYRAGDVELGQRQVLVCDPDGYLLRFAEDLGERPISPAR